MNWDAILWFVLMIVFLWMESSTVSLISIWFAAGSLAAMIAALFEAQLWLQAVLFVAVSVALLASLRTVVKKFITPNLVKTNVDAVVGSTGIVVEAIDNIQGVGQVKLGGMQWSARSTENVKIPENTLVTVDRVEGVKVFVTENRT
ncbi:MAG: NfeD family protein [Oscillospiraceae bacterium]|nr:NfeD family protein [Oscillospiraceae bacterium]